MSRRDWHHGGGFGGIYFLGFVASAIYYIQHSNGFDGAVVGIIKALVWPAFIIYKVFVLLHM